MFARPLLERADTLEVNVRARQQGRRDSPWPSAIVVIEVYMNRAASIHEPLFH